MIAVLVAVIVVLGGGIAFIANGQGEVEVPSVLQAAPQAAATARAEHVISKSPTTGACIVVTNDPDALLPTPYQRCSSGPPGSGQVSYIVRWNDDMNTTAEYGLVFAPLGPGQTQPDECIRQLGKYWMAVMGLGAPQTPCAAGFTFIKAP